ncbi:MAG: NAD+ kinase [Elusimicrobia bacterium GWA2_69_24]|nr:MAG: NAD+ kinase [Elusimicrobia bacterium GWA2_69_24]HBL18546.1 NAD+ kinase [Elusimicrobiota bacterium]
MTCEKLVLVTRATRLEGLLERFPTRAQARFWLEREGRDYSAYEAEHGDYHRALDGLRQALDFGLPVQTVERSLVPSFTFLDSDLVVTAGPDGLVANTAKYVGGRPIVAVNPDPTRIDGILLPFSLRAARPAAARVMEGRARLREVTMAGARSSDGQRLLAFNDLFIGARSHVSARYSLSWGGRRERQCSSGVLVSTGAGSTGWLSSVFNMTAAMTRAFGGTPPPPVRLGWEDPRLVFAVREPFASKESGVSLGAGLLEPGTELGLESLMPSGGAVFSDGVEADFLAFDSGTVLRVSAAEERARLVVPDPA